MRVYFDPEVGKYILEDDDLGVLGAFDSPSEAWEYADACVGPMPNDESHEWH